MECKDKLCDTTDALKPASGEKAARKLVPKRLVDRTLVAWVLENLSIVGVSWLTFLVRKYVAKMPEKRSFVPLFLNTIVGSIVMIEGSIAVQKGLVEKVYSHVPYFTEGSERVSKQSLLRTFKDWVSCNLPVHVFATTIITAMYLTEPEHKYQGRVRRFSRGFSVRQFLAKLALVRFLSDIAFYSVHRALHTRSLYHLHKRHHEHNSTAILTNFHFSWPDLFLEGFCPIFFGVGCLEALKIRVTGMEEILLAAYFQWYEIGSHSGKAVPTVSFFPPLSPLYKLFLGDIDKRNIEFHDQHHALRNCNYGISQWLDRLLGTAEFGADKVKA